MRETAEQYAARRAQAELERSLRQQEYQARQVERQRKQQEYEARQLKKQMMDNAHAEKRSKNYDNAINQYSQILSHYPGDAIAFLSRGQCYDALEKYEEAIRDYANAAIAGDAWFQQNKVTELHSSFAYTYSKLAFKRFQEKNFRSCIECYNSALKYENKPDQMAYCYYYRGISQQTLGNLTEARLSLELAVKHKPDEIKFLIRLAHFFKENADYENALMYYEKVAQIDRMEEGSFQAQSYCFKKLIERRDVNTNDIIARYGNFLEWCINNFPDSNWTADDFRWLNLVKQPVFPSSASRVPTILELNYSVFDKGEFEYRAVVLNWTLEDIKTINPLKALASNYSNANEFYSDQLPLILEESKAVLRQSLQEDNHFILNIYRVNFAKKETNIHTLTTSKIPPQYLEAAQSSIAIWLTFNDAKNDYIYHCLGLATVVNNDTQIKFICTDSKLLSKIKHTKSIKANYLGSLITYERMYTVCCEKSQSPIVDQISSGQLQPWQPVENHNSLPELDFSQSKAVMSFLASPTDNLYLLQGPPGTGKTTTITSLLKQCITKQLRVLVTAPSNKAVQEIAARSIKLLPNEKIMLAGVKEKLSDDLYDIFVHEWFAHILSRIKTPTQFAASEAELYKLLKCTALGDELQHYLNEFSSAENHFIKYYPEYKDFLYALKRKLQLCYSHLSGLSDDEKQQWLDKLDNKISQKNITSNDIHEHFEKDREFINNSFNKINSFIMSISALGENAELILLDQSAIVFASLSVCGRQSFKRLQNSFDVIIIDEAGQALLTECLIPLHFPTRKVLFVGDQMQLPATTFSETATKTCFDESIFSRLINKNSAPYEMLSYQYRMHPEIRQLPAKLFYDNQLLDGSNITKRVSPLVSNKDLLYFPYSLINVTTGNEQKDNNSYFNMIECLQISALVKTIRKNMPTVQIGIISFYQAQVSKLRQLLSKDRNVLISTVDGFQGGECDIVLISCVRANTYGNVGFVKDFRRVNVAITRARHGLVVFCHVPTFETGEHVLAKMITDARNRGIIFSELSLPEKNKQAISTKKIYKSKNCTFFAKGHCIKGSSCNYKHSMDDIPQLEASSSTASMAAVSIPNDNESKPYTPTESYSFNR